MALVWGWVVAGVGCVPSKVEVTTGEVWVEVVKPPLVVGKDTVWGVYRPDTRRIYIDGSLPYKAQLHILRHEQCHAVLSDEEIVMDSATEERTCEAIAKMRQPSR